MKGASLLAISGALIRTALAASGTEDERSGIWAAERREQVNPPADRSPRRLGSKKGTRASLLYSKIPGEEEPPAPDRVPGWVGPVATGTCIGIAAAGHTRRLVSIVPYGFPLTAALILFPSLHYVLRGSDAHMRWPERLMVLFADLMINIVTPLLIICGVMFLNMAWSRKAYTNAALALLYLVFKGVSLICWRYYYEANPESIGLSSQATWFIAFSAATSATLSLCAGVLSYSMPNFASYDWIAPPNAGENLKAYTERVISVQLPKLSNRVVLAHMLILDGATILYTHILIFKRFTKANEMHRNAFLGVFAFVLLVPGVYTLCKTLESGYYGASSENAANAAKERYGRTPNS